VRFSLAVGNALRVMAGLGSLALGAAGGVAVLAAAMSWSRNLASLAVASVALGVLGTCVFAQRATPLSAMRLSLVVAGFIAAAMLVTLSFAPDSPRFVLAERRLALVVGSVIFVLVCAERYARIAAIPLLGLGLHGAWSLFAFVAESDGYTPPPRNMVGVATLKIVIATSSALWISSVWHGRVLFARFWRPLTAEQSGT
jgi:hypothetical protein